LGDGGWVGDPGVSLVGFLVLAMLKIE